MPKRYAVDPNMLLRDGRRVPTYHLVQHPLLSYKLGKEVNDNVLVAQRQIGVILRAGLAEALTLDLYRALVTALGALLRRLTGNSEYGLAPVRLQSNGNLAAEM